MADPDGGQQLWQDYGSQELTALPPVTLVDPATARAVRAACWALCVALWLFIIVTAVGLVGLFVGVVGGAPSP